MHKKSAVLVLPVWPGHYSGHAIAFMPTLKHFESTFDVVHCIIALGEFPRPNIKFSDRIVFHELGIRRSSVIARFISSRWSPYPAFCRQFSNYTARSQFTTIFDRIIVDSGEPDIVFVEHLPVFALFSTELTQKLRSRLFVRSHDVLFDAFYPFSKSWNPLVKFAWNLELKKIRRYEQNIISSISRFASISEADSDRYEDLFQRRPDCVLGVAVPFPELFSIPICANRTVLHIGGMDMRKRSGLSKLVDNIWPKIFEQFPDSKLLLVGAESEKFSRATSGIEGHGQVDALDKYYAKSSIFVNPQEVGSGVKVKSLNAMAAGKILISHKNGVSGIPIVNGSHCLVAADSEALGDHLLRVLSTPRSFTEMAARGRDLIAKVYSTDAVSIQYKQAPDLA